MRSTLDGIGEARLDVSSAYHGDRADFQRSRHADAADGRPAHRAPALDDRRVRAVARASSATPPRHEWRARPSPRPGCFSSSFSRMPRPRWRRVRWRRSLTSDRSVIAIDFHAHTKYSHDGRFDWTEDDVRRWQRGAGFDAAYITDHRTFEGARARNRGESRRGGGGNDAPPGNRGRGTTASTSTFSARVAGTKACVTADLRDVDEQSLMLANMFPATTPLIIETIPGNLSKVLVPNAARRSAGVQRDRDRRRLAARTVAGTPRPRAHRPSRRQSQPRARLGLRQSRMGTRRARRGH